MIGKRTPQVPNFFVNIPIKNSTNSKAFMAPNQAVTMLSQSVYLTALEAIWYVGVQGFKFEFRWLPRSSGESKGVILPTMACNKHHHGYLFRVNLLDFLMLSLLKAYLQHAKIGLSLRQQQT